MTQKKDNSLVKEFQKVLLDDKDFLKNLRIYSMDGRIDSSHKEKQLEQIVTKLNQAGIEIRRDPRAPKSRLVPVT